MKPLLAFFLGIVMLSINLHAQKNYKLIKVNGAIQYVSSGSKMTQGDIFADSEDLSFESPTSRAAVINPGKGRFILTPQSANQLSGTKSHFLPAMSNISTRGGTLNSLNDIQDQFTGPVAILQKASWHINPYQFPMDENSFFYLQYQHHGEQINKKLLFENREKSMEEINQILENHIESWKAPGGPEGEVYEQVDDVIVIGIRI
jgi:hypothetical protein